MGIYLMVGKTGFEPATPWSQTRCSTKLSHFPNFYGAPKRSRTPNLLIRSQTLYPIELWALFSWCLGPESNRHGCHHPQDFKSCASTSSATQAFHLFQGTRLFLKNGVLQRTRTSDPLIKSQMLYRLSYERIQYLYNIRNIAV